MVSESAGKTFRLVVRRGKRVGRQFALEGDAVQIGAGRQCAVGVKGNYVDEVHAELARRGELWALTNQSVNGTLVNGARVTAKVLEPGDLIQIGGETLLEFQVVEPRAPKVRAQKTKKARSGLLGNPLVVGGVAVYLVALVGAGVYFTMTTGGVHEGQLSAAEVDTLVKETVAFLGSDQMLAGPDARTDAGTAPYLDGAADPATTYYRILAARRAGAAPHEADLDSLARALQDRFSAAWFLEQQGRTREAIRCYEEIQAMLPDGRAPATRVAAAQRQKLLGELQE